MLDLPDVTLVLIDNKEVGLAQLALRDTLARINPKEVHIYSDRQWTVEWSGPVVTWLRRIDSIRDVEAILWKQVWQNLTTSHMLTIQWDGWVLDETIWDPDFLQYDYIGAPWPWYMENRIGNGGFSLRSKALMKAVYPYEIIGAEDTAICRTYRKRLELQGFRWAPEPIARRFSFEREAPHPSFGFHGAFNLHRVLDPVGLTERFGLATDYAKGRSEWAQMMKEVARA